MAELGVVLEAPEVTEPVEGAEPQEPVAEAAPEAGQATSVDDVKGDERELAKWRFLKESNPELYRDLKSMHFGKKALDEKLNGFDLDGVKSWLDEAGGKEGIAAQLQEMQGKAAELDSIQQAISSGDSSIVAKIAQDNPESFPQIAQAAVQQWAQVDPEGWSAAMSGVIASTIQSSGVPAFLDRMELMLKYNDTANFGAALTQLKEWATGFQQAAQPPAKTQGAQPDKLAERERAIVEREVQQFTSAMESDVVSWRTSEIGKELKSFTDRKPEDAEAKQLAIETVQAKVTQRLSADNDFTGKVQALLAKRDKEGALRLIKSRESAAIREVAPSVGRTIFGQATPPKPATPAPARPVVRAATKEPTDPHAAIFARIAGR